MEFVRKSEIQKKIIMISETGLATYRQGII